MIIRWLTLFLILLMALCSSSLVCFECTCVVSPCICPHVSDANDGSHCIIRRKNSLLNSSFDLTRTNLNSTLFGIKDPYYIILEESIIYNKMLNDWNSYPSDVVYGCDWDNCNDPELIVSLPVPLKMSVNKTWLSENIYGKGSPRKCSHCPKKLCGNSTHPINFIECPIVACVKPSMVS